MLKKLAHFLIIKKFFAAEDFNARNKKKQINQRVMHCDGIGFEPHENMNQIMEILNKYLTNVTLNHYLNSAPQ